MKNGNFELEVCLAADEPKPLRQYGHDGRTFVEGKPGTPFVLVFRNHSPDRVEVVPSVDGLSVMDGKPATEDSEGYVVEPYRRVIVRGWRTSLKDSSKFVFQHRDGSYAAAVGHGTGQCGVVGVLIYREKERPKDRHADAMRSIMREIKDLKNNPHPAPQYIPVPHYIPATPVWPQYPVITWCASTAGLACGMGNLNAGITIANVAQNAAFTCSIEESDKPDATTTGGPLGQALGQTLYVNNLGTGWGAKQDDEVREVSFVRGPLMGEMEIQYNDRPALEALGIRFEADPAVPKYPAAFAKRVFCEPPSTHATKR